MAIQAISKNGLEFCKKIVNSKAMKKLAQNYEKDNIKFITGVAVTSIILKDALGCYMYVTQSLNNKKIPEEKRGFVAALDLANGGLMIGTQIIAALTISNKKVQQKIFNAIFGNKLNRSFRKGIIDKLSKDSKFGALGKKMLNDNFKDVTKTASDALGAFTTLIASTIVAKRMVVPFISTPLATYLKENYLEKGKGQTDAKEDPQQICRKQMQNNLGKYSVDNFTKTKQAS